jgi:hypothetical protein
MLYWLKHYWKRLLIVFFVVTITLSAIGTYIFWILASMIPSDDPNVAVRATLTWGRLLKFPTSARNVQIENEGGMFSRGYRISFQASIEEIDSWIKKSPGTAALTPKTVTPGVFQYVISPGEGAVYAEVVINTKTGLVKIYTSWS